MPVAKKKSALARVVDAITEFIGSRGSDAAKKPAPAASKPAVATKKKAAAGGTSRKKRSARKGAGRKR